MARKVEELLGEGNPRQDPIARLWALRSTLEIEHEHLTTLQIWSLRRKMREVEIEIVSSLHKIGARDPEGLRLMEANGLVRHEGVFLKEFRLTRQGLLQLNKRLQETDAAEARRGVEEAIHREKELAEARRRTEEAEEKRRRAEAARRETGRRASEEQASKETTPAVETTLREGPWQVLGLHREMFTKGSGASKNAIKAAYFSLMRDLHPDKLPLGATKAQRKLITDKVEEITEAYRQLREEGYA